MNIYLPVHLLEDAIVFIIIYVDLLHSRWFEVFFSSANPDLDLTP